ncbi:MAG TPA: tRNA dihydrouridine synthase DusB [Prolixibacteraceae bacterium]|jgi:nifR3 family TIM-barrel protein|nr:tRNA dihydrouridine synthase DusB [Bacteroidales bacterium]HOY52470.1 tRNA dihydrouridine synthase DusB [Prolixibacteraceae bacterium]HPJ78783.1 tRNA dihydrouridine synthase DusB [Prolixibacteraceae bacterium]HRV87861.1 tRNA dihydrouridine synthase DusB [Prolixibacteraceae bacterium]
MKIGDLELGGLPLFLAPMEDVTYKSFRYMCKKFGADVMYTEFVNSDALVRNVAKTKLKMSLFDFDRPVAIQIYGHDIGAMAEAAKVAEEAGPDFIDINFGCPMKKIVRRGAGAALLQDLPRMQEMAAAVVKAVRLPVTAKTRLGWDEHDKPVVEAALRLQDAGIAALAIHGRTRSQLYNGQADWTLIGEVKNHPRITMPIIGNGDVKGPRQAEELWRQSGVDGLMIGRPAIGRPWIFREIKHFLATGETLPPPSVEDVVDNVREQLQLSIAWKEDERRGILEMRRHLAKYFPHLPNFREMKIKLLQSEDYETVDKLLDLIAEEYRGMKVDYTDIGLS